jgi:DNA glycosylase AlkZ-like
MAPQNLTLRHLNRATLARQGLLQPLPAAPVDELVSDLGALQAQHPDWPAFAVSTRVRSAIDADIAAARADRRIVRAPLMRMTVHVVGRRDYWPASAITIGYRRAQFRALFKADPDSSALGRALTAAHPAVLEAMRERPLAIAEVERIIRARVTRLDVPPNRAAWRHFSAAVPLVLVPFDGEGPGRARYLPASEWLGPPPGGLDFERAATHMAERYLAAFGPASAEDFADWVGRGRGIGALRRALEGLGDRLARFRDPGGREIFDLVDAPRPGTSDDVEPRLLARWDSLLLGYGIRDRSRILPAEHQAAVITRNADVLPTFLVQGMVAGTWLPRHAPDGTAFAELRPFRRLRGTDRRALEDEAARLLPSLGAGAYARYPGTD